MGVLLAMRRLHRAELVMFLRDPVPELVLDAARAINDEPINGGVRELAALIDAPILQQLQNRTPVLAGQTNVDFLIPLLRRVLNANFHFGTPDAAKALASFAARQDAPETMRVEALEELADWPHPSGRDRVVGLWRPVAATRVREAAVEALRPPLDSLLRIAPASIRIAALAASAKLMISEAGPIGSELLSDTNLPVEVRVAALKTLAGLHDPQLEAALKVAQSDANEDLRRAATLLQGHSAEAATGLAKTLDTGTVKEKQTALAVLGTLPGQAADEILAHWLEDLIAGKVPREIQLDLLEAAAKRSAPVIKEKLAGYSASRPKDDPLSDFRAALFGGDEKEGKKIFFDPPETQCVRCHKINGQGGDVGPDLSHVSSQKDREYLLESIVLPNKQIAPGFESVMVATKDGENYAGVLKSEDAARIILNTPDSGLLTIKKSDIQSRQKALSPMPEGMGQIISKQDLRNLIEFLSGLK